MPCSYRESGGGSSDFWGGRMSRESLKGDLLRGLMAVLRRVRHFTGRSFVAGALEYRQTRIPRVGRVGLRSPAQEEGASFRGGDSQGESTDTAKPVRVGAAAHEAGPLRESR